MTLSDCISVYLTHVTSFIIGFFQMAEMSSEAQQPSITMETSLSAEPHATETQANTHAETGTSQVCTSWNP